MRKDRECARAHTCKVARTPTSSPRIRRHARVRTDQRMHACHVMQTRACTLAHLSARTRPCVLSLHVCILSAGSAAHTRLISKVKVPISIGVGMLECCALLPHTKLICRAHASRPNLFCHASTCVCSSHSDTRACVRARVRPSKCARARAKDQEVVWWWGHPEECRTVRFPSIARSVPLQ